MGFFKSCWETFVQVAYAQMLSNGNGLTQQPLLLPDHGLVDLGQQDVATTGLIFQVPGTNFTCNYTAMNGYKPCNTVNNRSCWLQALSPQNKTFDIHTDCA